MIPDLKNRLTTRLPEGLDFSDYIDYILKESVSYVRGSSIVLKAYIDVKEIERYGKTWYVSIVSALGHINIDIFEKPTNATKT